MKKRGLTGVVLGIVMVILALSGCGSKLSGGFEEEKVKQQAMEDVTTGESGDFGAWKSRFDPALAESLTEDIYNNYLALIEEKGSFKEFGKCAVAGQSDDGKDYAVVVLVAEHEEEKIQYTLIYNTDMQLINYTI